MRQRILISCLAITLFSFMFMWACGGSGYLSESDPTMEVGETVPVRIEVGSNSSGAYLASVSKDAGGSSEAGLDEGGVAGTDDSLVMSCLIEFGAETPDTGIEIVQDGADCTDLSKCLVCNNTWVDPGNSVCLGICEGQVPSNTATALDTIPLTMHFYADIKTDILSAGLAAIRQDGEVEAFDEADISNIVNTDPGDNNYSYLDCDGAPDMEMNLTDPMGIDAVVDIAPSDRYWSKGFTVVNIDASPDGDGLGECSFSVSVPAGVPLTGADLGAVDLTRGPVVVTTKFCDDMATCGSYVAYDGGFKMLVGETLVDILNNEENVPMPLILGFEEEMQTATLNSDNIIISPLTLYATQPSYSFEDAGYSQGSYNYELAFSESTPSYLYQNQELRAIMTGNVVSATGDPASYVDLVFSLGGAVSDGFVYDTSDNYDYDKVIINDPWPAVAVAAADAASYLHIGGSSWANRCMAVSDASKPFPGDRMTVSPTKDLIVQSQATLEIALNDIANFHNVEVGNEIDADLLGLRIADVTTGYFLFLGVRAVTAYDGEVRPICEVAVYDPLVGDFVAGSWRDCTGITNANFRLVYDEWTETLTAYMSEDPEGEGAVYERMDGANYNGHGAEGAKGLSVLDLPKSLDGASAVGLIFNSSVGNDRSLSANILKLESFGWRSDTLSWEPARIVLIE